MRTISLNLKLPQTLYSDLATLAARRGVSKSALVREALTEFFHRHHGTARGSALAQLEDLVGSIDGREDLSSNPAHLEDLGRRVIPSISP